MPPTSRISSGPRRTATYTVAGAAHAVAGAAHGLLQRAKPPNLTILDISGALSKLAPTLHLGGRESKLGGRESDKGGRRTST
jgi:hypothetical protein